MRKRNKWKAKSKGRLIPTLFFMKEFLLGVQLFSRTIERWDDNIYLFEMQLN